MDNLSLNYLNLIQKRYIFNMEFEYDAQKSKANQLKHGVSFEEAKQFWLIPGIKAEGRRASNEFRFIRIVEWNGKFYSCVFTIRENKTRLISVRRSRPDEIRFYREEMRKNEGTKEKEST